MTDETKHKSLMDDFFSNPLAESDYKVLEKGETVQSVRLIDVLPPDKKHEALEMAKNLDPTNHRVMIAYGTQAQKKLLHFSHSMIEHVQRDDVGEVSNVIGDLMQKLKEIDPDELSIKKQGFFRRLFSRASKSVHEILSNYQKASAQIDRMSVRLERSKNVLIADIHLLEQLYENNKSYFQDLNVYIAAAELKYEEMTQKMIPELKRQAEESEDRMKKQEVNDLVHFAELLEKRIYDLKISREITMQTAPQIRLIQHTNRTVIDKIQSSIMTAIPLWRNQVSIALTLLRQRYALETTKQMSSSVRTIDSNAREMNQLGGSSDLSTLEIESLRQTQNKLIDSLEETLTIQEDGRQKRSQAEKELVVSEDSLKQSMHTSTDIK
ncbi:toxic anion resistance protein [Bacillus sp. B1-b2]|uniref:toxic anion resistance protein n=1 Tax=Bacillus sp. B1-b2 TaxID=2653201 RepID=UPI00126288D8|nr:toxic anion resistance protein [Bacillus sp. B1-b2]KAB7664882.1 toxic anion resistance protein [Bacillus sp. B1-b2]